MAMNESIKNIVEREIQIKNNQGEVVENQNVKVTQHLYPCRPQVLERQKKWVKFGEAKNVAKGSNKRGVVTVAGQVNFINDEGQADVEIDIAKQLLAMSKQQAISKTMKR